MKNNVIVSLVVLVAVCFCTSVHVKAQGGSELPNPTPAVDVAPIVGEYEGVVSIDNMSSQEISKVKVTKKEDGEIVLLLQNFDFYGFIVDLIEMPSTSVTLSKNVYSFTPEQKAIIIKDGENNAEMLIKIIGKIEGNNMSLEIPYAFGVDEFDDTFDSFFFKGKKVNSSIANMTTDNILLQVSEKTVKVGGYFGLLQVFNTAGVMVCSQSVDNDAAISLESGVYILRMGNNTRKVIVL